MKYRVTIEVLADLPQIYDGPEMVAQAWASGLVAGIKYNRPEVIGAIADVQEIRELTTFNQRGALESDPQVERPALDRGHEEPN